MKHILLSALLAFTVGAAQAAGTAELLAACNAATFETRLAPDADPAPTAQAIWLDAQRLRWPGAPADAARMRLVAGSQRLTLAKQADGSLRASVDAGRAAALFRGPLRVVAEDRAGRVLARTGTQIGLALDALHARDEALPDLGVQVNAAGTAFRLWAPTAQAVHVCLYDDASAPAARVLRLHRARHGGSWFGMHARDLSGGSYLYLVDVWVPGIGLVRNRVTDPYSISLSTDSARSWIGRLDAAALKPEGWDSTPRPSDALANTDLVIYELHLRDFSIGDSTVPREHRGTYLAFTHPESAGMRHLQALRAGGVTDLHLLPVFDFATVPESGCVTPEVNGAPDGDTQQAVVAAVAARDCFNWGYDPLHYTAPEGSYATNAADGAVRIREFRRMVLSLHRAGLRVGMDMVYNHTSASGQKLRSVLDRIVPGYYQRLNGEGKVETSTCCDNTATERRMMSKLMIDSAVTWAREYRIDSMRFDLMGHQPRAAMERLQKAVDAATGRHIHLIGEGWNFGEVADGKLFVQAAQGRLDGTGIASFSDRARDAVRGGGCCDDAAATLARQGWINGLFYAPNPHAKSTREDLLKAADLVRVGLAGTLRDYRLQAHDGREKRLAEIDYAGQGAGYASQPGEVVNYVENHDNPTLFDIHVLKLPPGTSREDRARVQLLGLATTAFSQGVAYFHAGVELLRSKSLDRNSFDSGDWFNRIDWTLEHNFFGSGLPPKGDNEALWPAMKPLLADPSIKPTATEIRFTRDAFLDLLKIRASTPLFRLRSADEVSRRLRFFNTGPAQEPTLVVATLDGRGLANAGFAELLYAINVAPTATTLALPVLKGRAYRLHPVHATGADRRPAEQSRWDADSATLTVPPRTALVYVLQ